MDACRDEKLPTPSIPTDESSGGKNRRIGLVLCGMSAAFYSVAGILMRRAAGLQIDPTVAVSIREAVTVAIVAPWVVSLLLRGISPGLSLQAVGVLAAVSTVSQIVGNLLHQWALGVVGISIVVPSSFAAVLITGPLLGRLFLREPVSARSWAAVGIVIVAIVLLSSGARAADAPAVGTPAATNSSMRILAAVLGSALAGMTYAALTVVIRNHVSREASAAAVMLIVTGMGVLTVGPISAFRVGWEGWRELSTESWAWLLGAGTINFAGFISLTVGLRLTPVVHANILSAAQVAIAAAAGLLIFREPLTPTLIIGAALTIFGILLIGTSRTLPPESA